MTPRIRRPQPQSFRLKSWEWCILLAIAGTLMGQRFIDRPSGQIELVMQTLQAARLSGAQEYAVEQLQAAELSYSQAIKELDNQDEKFAWWRTYSQAKRMLNLALTQAALAKSEALSNLKESRTNAQTALALARQHIEKTDLLLQEQESHLTTQQRVVGLRVALQKASDLLATTESGMMPEGYYIQVMRTAHAVETVALTIQEQLLSRVEPLRKVPA